MSVLSERDITRELGTGILVHPLKERSLRGCCICLTASKYAYSVGRKQLLEIKRYDQSQLSHSDKEQEFFHLPPKDTILVWTDESIWLSNSFCGTVHSRVQLVSQGVGHLGTRVNPMWSGVLCIALHNLSDFEIRINVTSVEQPIAYLMVHRLSSKSSTDRNIDVAARLDVLPEDSPVPAKLNSWINDRLNSWRRDDINSLREKLKESEQYQRIRQKLYKQSILYWVELLVRRWAAPLAVSIFIFLYLWINQKTETEELILALIPVIYEVVSQATKNLRKSTED